ncbi:FAD-dependent oxidoreductase [Psychrobacter sp. I-STPA6b]|uniref:FAD-dependent oxidoreductase n=1 Tax=Psychrobacter sp. I-STPA6b TaxID=2585718 RepID=UPI001D0CD280|nr:FAD-dependent oxidoreductase [Psychrobacter sp. I-STPA6b]
MSQNNQLNDSIQSQTKKKILIAGGGISGLSAAFELSENPELEITIIESRPICGGKMTGYFNPENQHFEEHSIRALSSTYFSLFNIFDRANLLHMLTPVDDYQFYQGAVSSNTDSHVTVPRQQAISLHTIESMIHTFGLNRKNMLQLVQRIIHHVNASEEARQKMAFEKAGDVLGIEDFEPHTKQFIKNWFGILTGARMHSKAVDIMDSFVLMFLPMTEAPVLPAGNVSKSYCFNRPTSEVIHALVEKLQARGVKIITRTRIVNLHHLDSGKIRVDLTQQSVLSQAHDPTHSENMYHTDINVEELQKQHFDAAVMAIPHQAIWSMGLLPQVKKPFNDEWSFGTQYPLTDVPKEFEPFLGKSYNLCFDAPWNIVFQIQHQNGFWQDVPFPESYGYNLSATCSSPFNKGTLFGKRFMECTPDEAKEEILYQLGITDTQQRQTIAQSGIIDPINLRYTDNWQSYTDLETVEMGILQDNGKRWVNLAQIYVRNADDALIETKTQWDNIVLAGEIISVTGRWKIPTMEQAATSGKQAAQAILDYCKLPTQVNLQTSQLEHASHYKYLDLLVTVLNKASKLV